MVRRGDERRHAPLGAQRKPSGLLLAFTGTAGAGYAGFAVEKGERPGRLKPKARLSREVSMLLRGSPAFLASLGKAIACCGNGQSEVTGLVNALLGAYSLEAGFRKVKPSDCRLFQGADLLRSPEMRKAELDAGGRPSGSERTFFERARRLKEDCLKAIAKSRVRRRPSAETGGPPLTGSIDTARSCLSPASRAYPTMEEMREGPSRLRRQGASSPERGHRRLLRG